MSDRASGQSPQEIDAAFRESRTRALISVNLNTFWSIAIALLAFAVWDAYVDPAHWRNAFIYRAAGAVVVIATGLFQKLPGQAHWLPVFAKVRLLIALVASAFAASMLDRGYGFGVAGLVVIILTGTYIAVDKRDLLRINMLIVVALVPVMLLISVPPFDKIGTVVFVLLAIAASTLLGRVIEVSNRRAFALERDLHRDARTDSLTGLDNRRAMLERGRVELKRAQRSGVPVSVILCDLDHFKNINDKYGHEAGDRALIRSAMVLRLALRESDALGRWGGEEFMAVLVDTDSRVARDVAERMRAAVATTTVEGLPNGATISLGVSTQHTVVSPSTAWDAIVKEADMLLYQAKKEGRNRVIYTQA